MKPAVTSTAVEVAQPQPLLAYLETGHMRSSTGLLTTIPVAIGRLHLIMACCVIACGVALDTAPAAQNRREQQPAARRIELVVY